MLKRCSTRARSDAHQTQITARVRVSQHYRCPRCCKSDICSGCWAPLELSRGSARLGCRRTASDMTCQQALCALLAVLLLLLPAAALDNSNGFNSRIKWLLPDDLKVQAHSMWSLGWQTAALKNMVPQAMDLSSNNKPLLYLFSMPTCGACKRLKAEFTGKAGKDLVRASRNYLMINISGDEENKKFSVGS